MFIYMYIWKNLSRNQMRQSSIDMYLKFCLENNNKEQLITL